MKRNSDKIRKSKAQEGFEEAENAGRFAGNDPDSKAAKEQAIESIRQDPESQRYEHRQEIKAEHSQQDSDREARRDAAQSHDYKGEAQNVNDDTGRPLDEDELPHPRNKSMEGLRQNRDKTDRS